MVSNKPTSKLLTPRAHHPELSTLFRRHLMLTSISASLPNSGNNLGLFTGPCFRTVLLPTSFTTTLSENSTTKRCGTKTSWDFSPTESRFSAVKQRPHVLYFYSNPAIWPLFGYEGPSNDKARLSPSRLQRHRLDQERGLKFLCRKDLIWMTAA